MEQATPRHAENANATEGEVLIESSVRNVSDDTPPPAVSILPILSVNFVGTLGFSIVLPFLVYLVTRWGGNALVYGFIGAAYSAFQMIGAPILGRWSDRYGRRRILLVSQLGTLASWVLFAIAFALPARPLAAFSSGWLGAFALTPPLLLLFVARAFDGLTGGNVSVANAYLADISNDDNRNANFGKMAVSGNIGFVVGPALAGALGATIWGELLPVLAALLISVVASVMIMAWLPESSPCVLRHNPDQANARRTLSPDHKACFEMHSTEQISFVDAMRIPRVPMLLAIYFLVMLGFNFFYVAFPVFAAVNLEWTLAQTGAFFSVLSVMMVLVQGPVLGRASKHLSDGTLVIAGGVLLTASFPLFGAHASWIIYSGAALMALGNGLMWPSLVAVLSKAAGDVHQGAVQGIAGSCGAAASIIGLLSGGVLFNVIGPAIFVVSAATILVSFVLSIPARAPSA